MNRTGPQTESQRRVEVHERQQPGQQDTLGERVWADIVIPQQPGVSPAPSSLLGSRRLFRVGNIAQNWLSCMQVSSLGVRIIFTAPLYPPTLTSLLLGLLG